MYLFFSSDAFELYRRDVISSLALPQGYCTHFRYPKKLLPKDQIFIPSMKGKDGMIVYVRGNDLSKEIEDRNLDFLPIRNVTVIDIDDNATTGLVHIYLELKEFIRFDSLKDRLASAGQMIPPYQFIYQSDDAIGTIQCAWHDKIGELVTFDKEFKDKLFYQLNIRYQGTDGNGQAPVGYDPAERCSSFQLTDGKQYALDLAIYNSSRSSKDYEKHSIKLDYDRENFFITNPGDIIIGADRDNRSYKIVTKDLKSDRSASYIKFQSSLKGDMEGDKDVIACEVVVRLNINRNKDKLWAQLGASVCTFLGSVSGAYGASQLKADGFYPAVFIPIALVFFLGASRLQYLYSGKS
jgi:hypothetical protein